MKKLFLAVLALIFTTTTVLAQDNFRVRRGDTLQIEVLQDPSLNRSALVLPDGSISFPFIGSLQAAGRTTDQISQAISEGIASNFATQPSVFVSVGQLRPVIEAAPEPFVPVEEPTIRIYYLGEWASPGVREVPPGTTMLQALSQGGGFTNFAATRRIQLRRTNPTTNTTQQAIINYHALSNGAALVNDYVLFEGDVLLAPQRRLFE